MTDESELKPVTHIKIEVCKGQAGLALYVDDMRVAGPRHNGLMETVLSALYPACDPRTILALADEVGRLRAALGAILANHETVGAGASIFQCTTAEVIAARRALHGDNTSS